MAFFPAVAGPVTIWAGVGTGGAPALAGFSERGIRVSWRPTYEPFYTDYGGRGIETDRIYQGQNASITADIVTWKETTLQAMEAFGTSGLGLGAQPSAGIEPPGTVGSMMVLEGRAFPLWFRMDYSNKAAFSTIPFGLHFFNVVMAAPFEWDQVGATARKMRITWDALRSWDWTVANTYGAGQSKLYDYDMSAVASLPVS